MTEATQMAAHPATALAESLALSGLAFPGTESGLKLAPYRGALSPQQLDAMETETGALLFGAAVHDLGWLRRIALRGEDRYRWLSGMVTNVVETLPDQTGAYNLVLNAQGRIQGDAYVWRDGDALEVEVAAEQFDALMDHFDHFIIMDDVELVPLADQSALGVTGPKVNEILRKLGLPALEGDLSSAAGAVENIPIRLFRSYGSLVPHYELWTASVNISTLWKSLLSAGATAVGTASLETLRIVEGIPGYGIDIQSRDLAQETAQMRAISFTKGCYLGQEIVERVRSRGQVHRHLRALELTSGNLAEPPATGTELRVAPNPGNTSADAKPAGTLTSVTALQLGGAQRVFAIGMIRAEAEVGNRPLEFPGGAAAILHSTPKLTAV